MSVNASLCLEEFSLVGNRSLDPGVEGTHTYVRDLFGVVSGFSWCEGVAGE
jgi:hypothetical protein